MYTKLFSFYKQNTLIVILWALLLISCIYSAFYSSNNLSVNSDAIVYPYLFMDIPAPDQLLVSDKHSNILKMPLFALQAALPYNYVSFMIFNILLYLTTILVWVFLCIKILGKRAAPFILLTAIVVVLTAHVFNNELIYATVRNIEYPMMLCLFYIIGSYIFSKTDRFSPKRITIIILYFVLMAIMVAGDQFFIYISLLPAIAVLGLLLFNSSLSKKRVLYSIVSIIGILIGSYIVKALLDISGLYDLDKRYLSEITIPTLPVLIDSTLAVAHQWFYLLNTAIPPRLSTRSLLDIGLFVGVIITLITFVIAAYRTLIRHTNQHKIPSFIATLLFASSVALVCAYIGSGLAFQEGNVLDSLANVRYMTLLPLVLIFGIGLLFVLHPRFLSYQKYIYIIFAIILMPALYSAHKVNSQNYFQARENKANYIDLASKLKSEGVDHVLSGYWYGASLRFWSDNSISYAVVAECNKPSIENARRDWYKPLSNTDKTALVIDMSGRDLPFLGYCPGDKLQHIYGEAGKEFQYITNPSLGSKLNVWIYDYDTRQHTTPILTDPQK